MAQFAGNLKQDPDVFELVYKHSGHERDNQAIGNDYAADGVRDEQHVQQGVD